MIVTVTGLGGAVLSTAETCCCSDPTWILVNPLVMIGADTVAVMVRAVVGVPNPVGGATSICAVPATGGS